LESPAELLVNGKGPFLFSYSNSLEALRLKSPNRQSNNKVHSIAKIVNERHTWIDEIYCLDAMWTR